MRPLWPLYLFITIGLAFMPYPKVEPVVASFDERAGLIDDSDLVLETPKVSGKATWFDATRMGQTSWYTRAGIEYYAAAGPKLRKFADWRRWKDHVYILVTNRDTGISLMAELVDFCECSKGQDDERLVDLSPVLFEALGIPLSRGVQRVTIELLD